MLFNRIQIFDKLNATQTILKAQSIQEWKDFYPNVTDNSSYSLGNMISDTRNLSELISHNGSANFTPGPSNETQRFEQEPLGVLILVTVCYSLIFIAGLLGNMITCLVIYRNKSMHTATNYYLFNLAISDLTLLMAGKREFIAFLGFNFVQRKP